MILRFWHEHGKPAKRGKEMERALKRVFVVKSLIA